MLWWIRSVKGLGAFPAHTGSFLPILYPPLSLSSKTFPSPSLCSPESTFHTGVLLASETEHQAISARFYKHFLSLFQCWKLRSFQRPGPLLIFLVETSLRPFWIGRLMYSPVPWMPQRLFPKLLGPSLCLLCKILEKANKETRSTRHPITQVYEISSKGSFHCLEDKGLLRNITAIILLISYSTQYYWKGCC